MGVGVVGCLLPDMRVLFTTLRPLTCLWDTGERISISVGRFILPQSQPPGTGHPMGPCPHGEPPASVWSQRSTAAASAARGWRCNVPAGSADVLPGGPVEQPQGNQAETLSYPTLQDPQPCQNPRVRWFPGLPTQWGTREVDVFCTVQGIDPGKTKSVLKCL